MDNKETVTGGLRQRKKLATREALSRAALRLVVERGSERVRVEDIAAEVGVSPRTFNNYFSSKEEAIVALAVDRLTKIGAAVRARPASESLPDALREVVVDLYARPAEPSKEWLTQIRLAMSTPALHREYLAAFVRGERSLAAAIAERTGTDVTHDLYPRLLAATVFSACRVAVQYWQESDATMRFADVLRQAVGQVTAAHPPGSETGELE